MFIHKPVQGSVGIYNVQHDNGNFILVAVGIERAKFSAEWLNQLPEKQQNANVNLLGARVTTAWFSYVYGY